MTETLFFYDLETSGFNPREARIMQFAGQRTDLSLKPIGKPFNHLIKLSEDNLPDPGAILVTGITPQQTRTHGLSESEFLKIFSNEISIPGTIFVGFNNIRFDDEFIRFLLYRNFYDAYEWQWKEQNSRWDLLDVVRMTRALRPQGIKWPKGVDGKPTNRLELLASANNLLHTKAHDALSDVEATIAVAELIQTKQPRIFDYLLTHRQKNTIAPMSQIGEVLVYTSGKYASEFEKTTVVEVIAEHPQKSGVLVYDLRVDPGIFESLNSQELAEAWQRHKPEEGLVLPVKVMQFNRCPAIAPLGVLNAASQKRLKIDMQTIEDNRNKLDQMTDFSTRLIEALAALDKKRDKNQKSAKKPFVDALLYEGFFNDSDRKQMAEVRSLSPKQLSGFDQNFQDERLKALFPLYVARNFPDTLSATQRQKWEEHQIEYLFSGKDKSRAANYAYQLETLAASSSLTASQKHLIEELRLWGEMVIPAAGDEYGALSK